MAKQQLFLAILLLLQMIKSVSSVTTSVDLERNADSGLWKLKAGDYRNLENGTVDATLLGSLDPYLPQQNFNYSSFAFMRLMMTTSASDDHCQQQLVSWFRTIGLEIKTNKATTTGGLVKNTCVDTRVSTTGFIVSWVDPRFNISSNNKNVKKTPNAVSIKYLVGGNATAAVTKGSGGSVAPEYAIKNWSPKVISADQNKISLTGTVKSDVIMLMLDVVNIETKNITLFNFTPTVRINFKWNPNNFHVTEKSNVTLKRHEGTNYVTLTVLKTVYPKKSRGITNQATTNVPLPFAPANSAPNVKAPSNVLPTATFKPITTRSTTLPYQAKHAGHTALITTKAPPLPQVQLPLQPKVFVDTQRYGWSFLTPTTQPPNNNSYNVGSSAPVTIKLTLTPKLSTPFVYGWNSSVLALGESVGSFHPHNSSSGQSNQYVIKATTSLISDLDWKPLLKPVNSSAFRSKTAKIIPINTTSTAAVKKDSFPTTESYTHRETGRVQGFGIPNTHTIYLYHHINRPPIVIVYNGHDEMVFEPFLVFVSTVVIFII